MLRLSHLSLLSSPSDLSKKKNKKQPSRSPCLRPLVPQAGLHVLSTSSHGVRLLVSSPLPASSPPSIPQPPGPQPGSLSGACPRCSSGPPAAEALRLKSGPRLLRPPPFLRLLAHSQNRGARAQRTETSALVEPGGGGPETDSKHAQLVAVWEAMNAGERSAGAGRTESMGKGSARGSADGGGDSRREPAPGGLGSSWTPTAPGGRPTQRSEDWGAAPLQSRAEEAAARPALSEGAAVSAPGLPSPPRLPGAWNLCADAPAAVLSSAATFSTGQTGPCFWHFAKTTADILIDAQGETSDATSAPRLSLNVD